MLELLRRHAGFRRLWWAQVVSGAGDWFNRVALLTLIGALGDGHSQQRVGLLFGLELALRFMPTALLGPLAGPVADRLPRRTLMIAADLLRMLVVLGFLFIREPGDLDWLYVLLATQMGLSIFFDAARTAAMPDTVPVADLHAAQALSAATWSAMLTLGAWLGGYVVEYAGVRLVFVLDALSYLGSAWLLRGLQLPPVERHPEPFRWREVLRLVDLRRGLQHARGFGLLPVLLAKTAWWPAGGFLTMLAVLGQERFGTAGAAAVAGAGSAGLATGWLYGARGLGTGLGPILGRRWMGSDDRALLRQTLLGFLFAAVGYGACALADSLPLACLCVFGAHLGGSTIWVASTTLWQRQVHGAYRGRVFAFEFLCMTLGFTAGALAAGALYDATQSIEGTLWALCAALLVSAFAWWRSARHVPQRAG